MTTHITQKDLELAVERLNHTKGTPLAPYSKNTAGKHVANIGNYHLDYAYGGVKLVQMNSEDGGIRVISNGGYGTKRELYNQIHSMLAILER